MVNVCLECFFEVCEVYFRFNGKECYDFLVVFVKGKERYAFCIC